MKKLFLLIASGSIALSSVAQQKALNVVNTPLAPSVDLSKHAQFIKNRMHKSGLASKTTASAPRWYNYVDYFDANESAMSSSIDFAAPYLWGTDNALMAYGGSSGTTYDTVNFISYGSIIDPAFGTTTGFNDEDYYSGETKVTSSDPFTIDSIAFTGVYLTNPAKVGAAGFKDTLRVTMVYGNGGTTSAIRQGTETVAAGDLFTNYGAAVGSTFKYQYMLYNAARKTVAGSSSFTYDIILDNTVTPASWSTDTVNGLYVGKVPVSPAFNVPAGNMVGIGITFISGDNTFTPNDTVFFGSPHVPVTKYNMFRPIVAYRGSGATVNWLTYNDLDRNTGSYMDRVSTGVYSPHWFWSSGSSAATYQYPDVSFRLSACATCGVVGGVKVADVNNINVVGAYPNPAVNEVNIAFNLNNNADVTVKLINVIGQVVDTKVMGASAKGVAVFNTKNLPDGLYTYTVLANGERSTGRVVVAH